MRLSICFYLVMVDVSIKSITLLIYVSELISTFQSYLWTFWNLFTTEMIDMIT